MDWASGRGMGLRVLKTDSDYRRTRGIEELRISPWDVWMVPRIFQKPKPSALRTRACAVYGIGSGADWTL